MHSWIGMAPARREARAASERSEASLLLVQAQLSVPPEVRAVLHVTAALQDAAELPSAESREELAVRLAASPQEAVAHAAALREEVVAVLREAPARHEAEQPSEAVRDAQMVRPSEADLSAARPSSPRVRFQRGTQPARAGLARIAHTTTESSTA